MAGFNFLLANYQLTTATQTADIECNPGEVAIFEVLVESVSGGPSSASLAASIQLAPIEAKGYVLNQYTSGDQIQWQTPTPSDTYLGHLLLDGAFPSSLADHTLAAWRSVSRRILIPPIARLARMTLTPSFTGGTSPNFRVTVAVASYRP